MAGGPRCTPKASSLERKEDFITDQLQKRRKTEEEAIRKWKTETVAVALTDKPATFEAKTPTREDEHELEELNRAPFEIRAIPSLGRAPEIWAIPSQGREDLVHKPTSDPDHSWTGRGEAAGYLVIPSQAPPSWPTNLVTFQGRMQTKLFHLEPHPIN